MEYRIIKAEPIKWNMAFQTRPFTLLEKVLSTFYEKFVMGSSVGVL